MARRTLVKKDGAVPDIEAVKQSIIDMIDNFVPFYPTEEANNLFYVRHWHRHNSIVVNDVNTEDFSLKEKFHFMSWAGHTQYNCVVDGGSTFDVFVIYCGY